MELRQLKTFQIVAKYMSFNRAAEALNYAQSTVSTQIRLLEEEFGVPLFNRLGKRICLTEAGQMLMRYSQKMLEFEKETVARVSGWEEAQGSISIRIPQSIATYILPTVLRKFQAVFPKVGFDISTCAFDALAYELQTGITDLAFLLAESVPYPELETEVLGTEPLVVISSPDHPLAQRPAVLFQDLTGQSILLPKHDCMYKMAFQNTLHEEKVESVFIEVNSVEAIKQCVIKGVGLAMLPMLAVRQEITEKKLTVIPWPKGKLATPLLMIWHKGKWLSPALQSFMSMTRTVFEAGEFVTPGGQARLM